jgi:hypothetical protein
MAIPLLTSRTSLAAAKRRLAASSVAPVYASASNYTHYCVIPNANAYRFSPAGSTIHSEGDRA